MTLCISAGKKGFLSRIMSGTFTLAAMFWQFRGRSSVYRSPPPRPNTFQSRNAQIYEIFLYQELRASMTCVSLFVKIQVWSVTTTYLLQNLCFFLAYRWNSHCYLNGGQWRSRDQEGPLHWECSVRGHACIKPMRESGYESFTLQSPIKNFLTAVMWKNLSTRSLSEGVYRYQGTCDRRVHGFFAVFMWFLPNYQSDQAFRYVNR